MKIFSKPSLLALLGSTALVGGASAAFAQEAEPAPADEAVEEAEIVVRGVFIPDEMRSTSEVASLLDEEDLARTGDSDIGGALQRVSGISLSEGRFVIVRGLNERYSSVTLDGSPLPSPEPLRRVVPLDIVPTSILSGSLVQKTYSPQFSAEFGGGLVELRTRGVPDEPYLQFGLSVGGDSETWGQSGLTYDGDGSDDLGFDGGTRDIPAPLAAAFFGRDGIQPFDQNSVDTSLEFVRTTVLLDGDIGADASGSIAFGGGFDLNDSIRLGANVSFGYSNDWQTRTGRREQGFTDSAAAAASRPFNITSGTLFPLTAQTFDFTGTSQTVEANALASFGMEIGSDHTITWTNLLLRSTAKEGRVSSGVRGEETGIELLQENIEYFEREVWQTQLRGDHVFPGLGGLEIGWRAAYGQAYRDAPYQRQFRRFRDAPDENFRFLFGPDGFTTLANDSVAVSFSEVNDENLDLGVDFTYPFVVADRDVELRFGAAYTQKDRDVYVREFVYREGSLELPDLVLDARPDILLSPGVTGSDAFDINFITNSITLDNATSSLDVQAAYVGIDAELSRYLRFAVGGRYESSEQTTTAFATAFPTSSLSQVALEEEYFLPAATLTWNPIGDLQVRFGYSRTITRPQFRELTPATFLDDTTDQLVIGNPFLVNSEIDNFDARAEYYFSRGQFATFGVFYKDITNPIEVTSTQIGGAEAQTFVNAPSATLFGFEAEFERYFPLGELLHSEWLSTTDLLVKVNYTWSRSEVSADGTVTTAVVNSATGATPFVSAASGFIVDGRNLQGQSDNLLNIQLGIEDVERDLRATFLVNWTDERIRQTENIITGAPVVLETPPLTLDFVFAKGFETGFGPNLEFGFEVRNILGEDYEAVQSFSDGTEAQFDSYELGTSVEFSLRARF